MPGIVDNTVSGILLSAAARVGLGQYALELCTGANVVIPRATLLSCAQLCTIVDKNVDNLVCSGMSTGRWCITVDSEIDNDGG